MSSHQSRAGQSTGRARCRAGPSPVSSWLSISDFRDACCLRGPLQLSTLKHHLVHSKTRAKRRFVKPALEGALPEATLGAATQC